ncbi:MAG: hypothetical protein WBL67_16060 [Nitrososphaeraceae archaeon]
MTDKSNPLMEIITDIIPVLNGRDSRNNVAYLGPNRTKIHRYLVTLYIANSFRLILKFVPSYPEIRSVVSVMVLVDPVRSVLKTHATRLTFIGENKELDQMIEDKINELRAKYAALAGVLERIHKMDLRETAIGLLGIDAMESLLKLRALVILAS